uniref:Small ribosomal subunit protein uS5 n=1 Tax=Sus scrofa TaxID=9823 RepID=A0A4X1TTC9_PIG
KLIDERTRKGSVQESGEGTKTRTKQWQEDKDSRGKAKDKEWLPDTTLGHLESEITDFFLGASLKDEGLKSMPVQKQTHAGHRTRFKAFVAIGDCKGHVGLGVKCSEEVTTAIQGAITLAKLSVIPVWRGSWWSKIRKPHTGSCKVTGRCGSVPVCLFPAPRGTGMVSAPVPKKLRMMARIDDCYTSASACTAALGNFAKATFDATSKTNVYTKSPYQESTNYLVKTRARVSAQRTQAPAVATTWFYMRKIK